MASSWLLQQQIIRSQNYQHAHITVVPARRLNLLCRRPSSRNSNKTPKNSMGRKAITKRGQQEKTIGRTRLTRRLNKRPLCLLTLIYVAICTRDRVSNHHHRRISNLVNCAARSVSKLSQPQDTRRISASKKRQIPNENNKNTTSMLLDRSQYFNTTSLVVYLNTIIVVETRSSTQTTQLALRLIPSPTTPTSTERQRYRMNVKS